MHAGNHGDLQIVGILFGTFHNPAGFSAQPGFYDGASRRVTDMLLFRDVSHFHGEQQ
ncbi:hypothetical protein [Noviherbaspirillum sp.]|uniref:hypothetical protein n=1 Tax=Noviherbaspirillum sp. TaxID=1926288 RepID=UPI002FE0F6A2